MNEQVMQIMFALLRYEICRTKPSDEILASVTSEILPQLYAVSKRHDLAHLISDALEKHGLLPSEGEIGAKFRKQHMTAIYRYERINYEFNSICQTFEAQQIPFLPLKGSVLRSYYPEPWMRTSCDIDVLVHETDLERAIHALCTELQYRNKERGPHDVSLFSASGVHVELHYNLLEDERANNAKDFLQDVWDYAESCNGCQYHMVLKDEFFYFYHIVHMAKHLENGGCGARPFLDLWILEHRVEHDKEKRDEMLQKAGLLIFADTTRALAEIWFSQAEPDDFCKRFEDFVLNGGVYGNVDNRVSAQQNKRGGKFGYIMSRIFIPYGQLKLRYPVLQKHRWLTPFYEVRRWFGLLSRGRLKSSLHELDVNRTASKEQIDSVTEMFEKLGL